MTDKIKNAQHYLSPVHSIFKNTNDTDKKGIQYHHNHTNEEVWD